MSNRLLPIPANLEKSVPLTDSDRLFTFLCEALPPVAPGQFIEVSIPGVGGFPVSVCDLSRDARVFACIRRAGRVTNALFGLAPGAALGLRGPFGKGFDPALFKDRDVLLVAGGLGLAPLHALLAALLQSGHSQRLILLYGARNPSSLLFAEELGRMTAEGGLEVSFAVDVADDRQPRAGGIPCRLGLVTSLLDGLDLQPDRTTAVVSGPPAFYRGALEKLDSLGLSPEKILATLERRMRCGIGECCHCVTGGVYLCQEGPVFSLAQLRRIEGAI